MVREAGAWGKVLFQIRAGESQRGAVTGAARVARVNVSKYLEIFGDSNVFGDIASYTYPNRSDVVPGAFSEDGTVARDDADIPDTPFPRRMKITCAEPCEVLNLGELKQRAQSGPAVTGERRQDQLEAWIAWIECHGSPVKQNSVCANGPDCVWRVPRVYYLCDGVGAAWQQGPGIQNVTKETRNASAVGLPVGEIDLVCGAMQCIRDRLRQLSLATYNAEFGIMDPVIDHADVWKVCYGKYYGIELKYAKKVFTRLHMGGSGLPDDDANSTVPLDSLPCVLELQYAIQKAHRYVAESDEIYKNIVSLQSVQSRDRPDATAFAIYTQHLMGEKLKLLATIAEDEGFSVMAHVFDSIYVIACSNEMLQTSFKHVADKALSGHGLKVSLKSPDGVKLA